MAGFANIATAGLEATDVEIFDNITGKASRKEIRLAFSMK